ncbi:hypothetical protein PENSPDRAFT_598193 [Peniophora sp. CONT]|nr:hypothetical protein PENSPDRAFT_598193 [Peniophora sp. CONT]
MALTVAQGEMLSLIVEGILYGFSLFMYGVTLWVLLHQRRLDGVPWIIFIAATLLFILSTIRIGVDSHRVYFGFLLAENTDLYFGDTTKETFKNIIYLLQTLLGDGILIYRCLVMWRDVRVIILPCILWCSVAVTGIHTVWSVAQPLTNSITVFVNAAHWILSFYVLTLVLNAVTTGLLAFKIWQLNSMVAPYRNGAQSLIPIAIILLECGMLYTCSVLIIIITYALRSNSLYVMLNITGQIIPITFYLIIIRAGHARISSEVSWSLSVPVTTFQATPGRSRQDDTTLGRDSFSSVAHRLDAIEAQDVALQKIDPER